jgi:hypothetical protein
MRALVAAALLVPLGALAQECDGDAGPCVPVACDGGLCATQNGSSCGFVHGGGGGGEGAVLPIAAAALLLLAARRRVRLAGLALALIAATAQASDRSGAVDVNVSPQPAPRRILSIEWNPLPLLATSRASFNVAFAPAEHHALTLSPFYSWAGTEPISLLDASGTPTQRLPRQTFNGFGAELGYRYFTGAGGLRGFFVGPSLIAAHFVAGAEDGTQTPFWDLGVALDAGWQMLVADRLVVSLGGGVQVLVQDRSIPPQSFPARLYANGGVLPRLLLSIGWAF